MPAPLCGLCGAVIEPASSAYHEVPCRVGVACAACHQRVRAALAGIAAAAKCTPVAVVEVLALRLVDFATPTVQVQSMPNACWVCGWDHKVSGDCGREPRHPKNSVKTERGWWDPTWKDPPRRIS